MQDEPKLPPATQMEILRLRAAEPSPEAPERVDFSAQPMTDLVADERPVNIEINGVSTAVVMALPGDEEELAAGFALGERLIRSREDLLMLRACEPEAPPDGSGTPNQWPVRVKLVIPVELQQARPTPIMVRYACGTVGEALAAPDLAPPSFEVNVPAAALLSMLRHFSKEQATFLATGCTHAAALFDAQGELLVLKEDIGRHNAIDRVLGYALLNDLDLTDKVLVTSGRASADLAFKALSARIPVLASLSAPTALAVDWARRGGLTLVGFLRSRRFNIYSHPERISP